MALTLKQNEKLGLGRATLYIKYNDKVENRQFKSSTVSKIISRSELVRFKSDTEYMVDGNVTTVLWNGRKIDINTLLAA